jgi:hypothetical protein
VITNDLLFDAARRSDEHTLHGLAAGGKDLSNRDAWEEMPPRPAAGKHDRLRRRALVR